MNKLLLTVAALSMLAIPGFVSSASAVDSSYHPSCRGEAKAQHANFCAQIEGGPLVTGSANNHLECASWSQHYDPCKCDD